MQNSEKHLQGNEHPAGSVDRTIFECGERAWDSRADVSGADNGPAARGIVGPTVGGLGCSKPYPLDQQKRRTARWKVGHQYTENVKFHPNSAAPTVKLLVEEHDRHPANPYLFPSPRTGETWDPDGFRRLHERIIKEIGAEHVRFHDMRHTFATLSLKSGVDVRTLSETLGHFSAGFTLSTYVHSTPGMKQSAADAIGNTIRNAI